MIFLYRKNGGQVLGVSTDANAYGGLDATIYGTVTDPPTPDGLDLSTPKTYDLTNLRNATAPEIANFATAEAADKVTVDRATAVAWINTNPVQKKILQAIVDTIITELNILRGIVIGQATTTFDPANMTNGSGVTSANITVAGAQFGDVVDVTAPYTLGGIVATAYVSAADTVNIRLHNSTGGAVNLASGNWTVTVRRQSVMAARTLAQARTAIINEINAGTVD